MKIPNFTRRQSLESVDKIRVWEHDDTGHFVAVLREVGFKQNEIDAPFEEGYSVAIADENQDIIGKLFENQEDQEKTISLGVETARQFPDEFEKYHDGNSLVVAQYGDREIAFEDETINEVIVSGEDVERAVSKSEITSTSNPSYDDIEEKAKEKIGFEGMEPYRALEDALSDYGKDLDDLKNSAAQGEILDELERYAQR